MISLGGGDWKVARVRVSALRLLDLPCPLGPSSLAGWPGAWAVSQRSPFLCLLCVLIDLIDGAQYRETWDLGVRAKAGVLSTAHSGVSLTWGSHWNF